jgi:hypothetical protein
MSPEAQRIAIAEACGWSMCRPRASEFSTPWISGLNPNPDEIVEVIPCDGSPARKPNESDYGWETIPNYLTDLNAMHEAEKAVLMKDVRLYIDYARQLEKICGGIMDSVFATAAQRAEAFLRTLGKWEDGK